MWYRSSMQALHNPTQQGAYTFARKGSAPLMRELSGLLVGVAAVGCLALSGCKDGSESTNPTQVVVYTSVDDVFARPIAQRFEQETGIKVLLVPDTEETKSAGLLNRTSQDQEGCWQARFDTTRVSNCGEVLHWKEHAGAGERTVHQCSHGQDTPQEDLHEAQHWFACRTPVDGDLEDSGRYRRLSGSSPSGHLGGRSWTEPEGPHVARAARGLLPPRWLWASGLCGPRG